jgi:hypothetical protein
MMINFIVPGGNEAKVFKYIETYFKHFSGNRGNAMWIWISSPFLETEDKQVGEYDSVKFQRIDRIICLAKKYHIRLKFTLQHIRTIQPVSPPGFAWTNNSLMSVQDGGPFKNIEEYVDTKEGQHVYLNMVKALVSRYRQDTTIFCWELWNEMDAVDHVDWYAFSVKMLDSVEHIFPNQLVVQSLGSLFNDQGIKNYERYLTLKSNDYICLHRYLDPGKELHQNAIVMAPIDSLVSQAVHKVYVPSCKFLRS